MDQQESIFEKQKPVIDVSYVELPEKVTYRIDTGYIMGVVAFFAMVAAPGTAEENPILAFLLVVVFGVCAHLSTEEDGKRK